MLVSSLVLIFIITPLLAIGQVLLRIYMNGGVCYCRGRLDGRTVIVTGANTGIGKITARLLASRGARIILACRNVEAGHKAVDWIRQIGCPGANTAQLVVKKLDLADMDSVRKFAQYIIDTEERLDILINNAGVMRCPKSQTKQGYETHYAVNHLGHFLLTYLLLPVLERSASKEKPSRVINVSSLGHKSGLIDFDDLNCDRAYTPRQAYCNSKLMNILFTRELALRCRDRAVVAYSLHPGVACTELGRHMQKDFSMLYWIFVVVPLALLLFKSPWYAAQTSIHLALKPHEGLNSGDYFSDCRPKRCAPAAYNDDVAGRLWEVSKIACGLR
ncbi:retinol dehydrogenase 12-like [Sycon ciliatum]|uniref:retinol dehydrogenase 12-like n=1 Tax=Sycon ciliatum TaxID=27933 RepID=UPI0031F6D351